MNFKENDFSSYPKSAAKAKELGLKFYYTNIPCKKGHMQPRFANDGWCVGCSKEYYQKYYQENKEKLKQRSAERYADKKDEINSQLVEKYKTNPEFREKQIENSRRYRKDNPEKSAASHKRSVKRYYQKRKNCPDFMMAAHCRRLVNRTIEFTGAVKTKRSHKELGYTPKQLREHIEGLFSEGMSWENRSDWHIDHQISIHEFIQLGVRDLKKINALENLRPIWAKENLSKGDSFALVGQ